MRIYKINPENFGQYKNKLAGILRKPNLLGVFSEGCGHCHAMKPQWEQLKNRMYGEKNTAGLIELDSRVVPNIGNESIQQKINGYPTILIIKNGKPFQEYSGDRSTDNMYGFCKQHLFDKYRKSNSVRFSTQKKRPVARETQRRRKKLRRTPHQTLPQENR